jgi:hypothetical protein
VCQNSSSLQCCYVVELSTPASFVRGRSKSAHVAGPRCHEFRIQSTTLPQHTRLIISAVSMGAKSSYLTQASLIKWRCHKCSLCNIPMHPLTQLQAANVGPRWKSATNVSAADTNVANGGARLENCRPTSCGWERAAGRNCEKGIEWWKCCERVVWRYKPLTMFYDITGNLTVLLRPRCYV